MLRALVLLLLLGNVLWFAWARGWLGPPPRHAEREPQRLAAQVSPEAVVVLPPRRASAAVQAAQQAVLRCVEIGPLQEPELGRAEYRLAEALVAPDAVARVDAEMPGRWIVFGGRYPEAGPRNAREAELRRLGLSVERLNSPPELAPGFVLSRHDSRAAAEAWLKDDARQALRGARVIALPGPADGTVLRVAQAAPEQADKLTAVGFRPCAEAR